MHHDPAISDRRADRARRLAGSHFGDRQLRPVGVVVYPEVYADVAMGTWVEIRDAFGQAAEWFVGVVPAGRGCWEETGLGEWSIRDLVGHTSRALLTVESYLDKPAAGAEVGSAVKYFRLVLASSGDPAAVAQRGRDAGATLGDDPAVSVEAIVHRVLDRVRAADGDALVATPVGGMRLVDYLPTRTFELTVHTCDLATALGRPLDVPESAATQSLAVLGGLAVEAGVAPSLLLSATGRQPLPAGFSVL